MQMIGPVGCAAPLCALAVAPVVRSPEARSKVIKRKGSAQNASPWAVNSRDSRPRLLGMIADFLLVKF